MSSWMKRLSEMCSLDAKESRILRVEHVWPCLAEGNRGSLGLNATDLQYYIFWMLHMLSSDDSFVMSCWKNKVGYYLWKLGILIAPTSAYQPSLWFLNVSTRPPIRSLASIMVTYLSTQHKISLIQTHSASVVTQMRSHREGRGASSNSTGQTGTLLFSKETHLLSRNMLNTFSQKHLETRFSQSDRQLPHLPSFSPLTMNPPCFTSPAPLVATWLMLCKTLHLVAGILQKLGSRQSSDAPADDCHMARCLCGRKTFIHDVEKLAVVCVLEALKQRVSNDPVDSENYDPDENQRNWGRQKIQIEYCKGSDDWRNNDNTKTTQWQQLQRFHTVIPNPPNGH